MRSPFCPAGISVALAGLFLGAAAAAPLSPNASGADIRRWFVAANVDAAAPQRWAYTFAAADARALEALSVALVRNGYEIVTLAGGVTPILVMAKAELHSPATLAQRNQSLQQMAATYRARYDGCEVFATSFRGAPQR